MKYSTIILSLALGAFAIPQDATTTSTALTSEESRQACVKQCAAGDVTCQAECLGSARANTQQVLDSTKCAMECDQGEGSPEDTKAYGDCQQACYYKYFPSSQTLAPASAVSGAAATGGAQSSGSSPSGTGSEAKPTGTEAEKSGSAAESSSPSGAANSNNVHLVGAGFAGLLLAVFGL